MSLLDNMAAQLDGLGEKEYGRRRKGQTNARIGGSEYRTDRARRSGVGGTDPG